MTGRAEYARQPESSLPVFGLLLVGVEEILILKDQAFQSLSENSDIEVDKQPYATTGESKVCEQLGFMDWQEFGDRFEFDDDPVLNKQVNAQPITHFMSLVVHGERYLLLRRQAPNSKFAEQALLVDFLEKPGPPVAMNLHRGPDDLMG